MDFVLNLQSLWELGDIKTKRAIQYMVFTEGICYDFKNHRARTFRVKSIFSAIASISGDMGSNKKENYHKKYDNSLEVESERQSSNFLNDNIELIISRSNSF